MRLHEADGHLEYVRLHLAIDQREKARESLARAEGMIEEMGYHRRDGEVEDLERAWRSLAHHVGAGLAPALRRHKGQHCHAAGLVETLLGAEPPAALRQAHDDVPTLRFLTCQTRRRGSWPGPERSRRAPELIR